MGLFTWLRRTAIVALCVGLIGSAFVHAEIDAVAEPRMFRVLAFYTGKDDLAHVSFVREALVWFPRIAREDHFAFEATTDWTRLADGTLAQTDVVVFLDTRPEDPMQRQAFQRYMQHSGAWLGFHFAAFALNASAYPDNWSWYNDDFLGCGAYVSNTWRPTAAILRVENSGHPALRGLPATFRSAPNEWYRWSKDLRANPDIDILLAIDPASFPLGTGPKPHEIWHDGYYPVVWTNKRYRMVYINMGHNDLDYEGHTNRDLSLTFANETESRLIRQSLLWLGHHP